MQLTKARQSHQPKLHPLTAQAPPHHSLTLLRQILPLHHLTLCHHLTLHHLTLYHLLTTTSLVKCPLRLLQMAQLLLALPRNLLMVNPQLTAAQSQSQMMSHPLRMTSRQRTLRHLPKQSGTLRLTKMGMQVTLPCFCPIQSLLTDSYRLYVASLQMIVTTLHNVT